MRLPNIVRNVQQFGLWKIPDQNYVEDGVVTTEGNADGNLKDRALPPPLIQILRAKNEY